MSSEWIDAYNQWVVERYKVAGSLPDELGIRRSDPREIGENGCTGCYHYRGKFIRLPACPMHGSAPPKAVKP